MTIVKSADEPSRAPSPFLLAFVAAVVVVLLAFLPRAGIGKTHPLVGKPAPDFTLDVVHNGEPGARMALASLRGRPVVIDFWATWCGPCQLEAPILSRVAERYRDRGLVVLGVNTSDKPGLAAPFAAKKSLRYPIVFDDGGHASDAYAVQSLPTLVIVGKDGTVRAVRSGLVDESALDTLIGSELLTDRRWGRGTTTRR